MARIIKANELQRPPQDWQPGEAPLPASLQAATLRAPEGLGAPPLIGAEMPEEEGRRRGLAQGIQMAEEAYRSKLARLESLSAALQVERSEFFARIEPELVRLAVSIAEKVVQRELELRPETVLDLIRSGMKRLRDREVLRVSVNPRDVERVKEARDDLVGAVDGVRKLEVVEDRRVDPGGCVIESPNGTLDARISTQLDEISRVLADLMPDSAADSEERPASRAGESEALATSEGGRRASTGGEIPALQRGEARASGRD